MKWIYKCPHCDVKRSNDFKNIGGKYTCNDCNQKYIMPGPYEQFCAYVEQRKCPKKMEQVVHALKGTKCVIKNCPNKDDVMTLDHILAWNNNGKTSVCNLQPMCKSHNSSKNDDDFRVWMKANGLQIR